MTLSQYLAPLTHKQRMLFDAAKRLGVKIKVVSEESRLTLWMWKGKAKLMYEDEPRFNPVFGARLMRNKHATKEALALYGFEVPRGVVGQTEKEIFSKVKQAHVRYPVVVKPSDRSEGIGVVMDVKNEQELAAAIKKVQPLAKAKAHERPELTLHSEGILVEELVPGSDHRVLVIDGKVVACTLRMPAQLVGNGHSTLLQLMDQFNTTRPEEVRMRMTEEARALLKEQGVTLKTVLEKGRVVKLAKASNVSLGGRALDYTSKISARYKTLCVKVTKDLGLRIAGIDLLTPDITSSSPKQRYGIIEINGLPSYNLHQKPVVEGKGVDVAAHLVRAFMK